MSSNGFPIEPQQTPDTRITQAQTEPQQVITTQGGRRDADESFYAPDNLQVYENDPIALVDPLLQLHGFPPATTSAPFDVEQFAEAVANADVKLTLADLLLLEMVKFQRRSAHHKYGAPIVVPIVQTVAGYTKVTQPPSANQYLKVISILLSMTAAGTIQFLQGTNGSTSDAALTGIMGLATGIPMFLHAPNPDANPIFVTSPGMILGINSATSSVNGLIVYQLSADDK
jgi:hypothetical protein